METVKLYKYLDAKGGLSMLSNGNIQFTNATKLNDPFDCHPSLIDFSHVPTERARIWGKEDVIDLESNRFEHQRDNTWLCSLSKNYDSLLMWSYYNYHEGICIGIDMEKADKYLSRIWGSIILGYLKFDVQYKDILEKPDFFKREQDLWSYQLSTKTKAWEHEQEVRLVIVDPSRITPYYVPSALNNKESIDYKEIRFIPNLGGECYDSVYLGVNMDDEKRTEIIEAAKKLNPNIKIYQMKADANAFKLQTEQII
ncbi:MAG: DUF2971 domain-containing protein [Bacteroides sp.]|nr:DUF2971 domain-containing protein [Bacteroides sp.]MBQ8874764.1 DUF2971 domain-containing protein [Bacteroides sp.]